MRLDELKGLSKLKKTHEDFIAEMRIKHPNIRIVGTYTGCYNKIEWLCSGCGESQFSLPGNLLKPEATGLCRKCFNLQLSASRTKGSAQLLQELHNIHPDLIITGTYQGKNHEIEWVCSSCGKKQYSLAGNLLKPSKQPYCRSCYSKLKSSLVKDNKGNYVREKNDENDGKSIKQRNADAFYEKLNEREHPPIVLSEYNGVREKIRCRCSVCGHEWESRPRELLISKHPCPRCADQSRVISNETFVQRLSKINPYVIPLEEYVKYKQSIKCRCSRCGHEWSVTPGALLSGNGCPNCSHTGTSFFEQFLMLSLKDAVGDDRVISRDRKAIGSELDVYIPDMKLAFEYGAWFYHKRRISNDLKKVKLCEEAGIRLIRIYDACGNESIGGIDVLSYPYNIALDINDSIEAVNRLFSMTNIRNTISEERWSTLADNAYILSRRMTTDQFKEKIAAIQPNIEILGEYKSGSCRIACRCRTCGHTWNPTAHGLLAGYGCPNCYNLSKAKPQETFLQELKRVNSRVELLEPYVASNKRILVKCKKCGHQWRPYASNLLHGYGCAVCKKKAMEQKAIDDILRVNPNLEIVGKYQGMSKPIKVKCKKCGNIWSPTVDNLVRDATRCPDCSRKNANQKLKMSTEEFVKRLSEISPTIEVVGAFKGVNNRVNVCCKKCGYEWSPRAADLLTGRGCRECKYKERAVKARRTPAQFVQEMSIINPDIIVLGEYVKANERIEVECKRCGRKWNPKASSLIAGTGCPSCSKKKNANQTDKDK